MIVNGIVITVLTAESISDIRTKTISLTRLIIYMVVGIIANIVWGYQSIASMIGGAVVGVIFLGFAILSREGIGYGDGGMFICLGIALGLYTNLRLLVYSLFFALVIGGIYAVAKKKNLKTRIPFIPCVWVTFVFMTIMEAVT